MPRRAVRELPLESREEGLVLDQGRGTELKGKGLRDGESTRTQWLEFVQKRGVPEMAPQCLAQTGQQVEGKLKEARGLKW